MSNAKPKIGIAAKVILIFPLKFSQLALLQWQLGPTSCK